MYLWGGGNTGSELLGLRTGGGEWGQQAEPRARGLWACGKHTKPQASHLSDPPVSSQQ